MKYSLVPDFKTYCKATIIKTVLYEHKKRHTEQHTDPETNPHIYGQLILDTSVETTQQGKDSLFTNNAKKTGYPYAKE